MVSEMMVQDSLAVLCPGQSNTIDDVLVKLANSPKFASLNAWLNRNFDVNLNCYVSNGRVIQQVGVDNTLTSQIQVLASIVNYSDHASVVPKVVAGYSVGQWTSMYVGGMLDLSLLLEVVTHRAMFMSEAARDRPGGMVAVIGLATDRVVEVCVKNSDENGVVVVSNFNAVGNLTISGDEEALRASALELKNLGARQVVRVNTEGAWHSPLMKAAGEKFRQYLQGVRLTSSRCPVVDNVTGELVSNNPQTLRDNLAEQMYSPVRWENGMRTVFSFDPKRIIEVGFSRTLAGFGLFIDRSHPIEYFV